MQAKGEPGPLREGRGLSYSIAQHPRCAIDKAIFDPEVATEHRILDGVGRDLTKEAMAQRILPSAPGSGLHVFGEAHNVSFPLATVTKRLALTGSTGFHHAPPAL